MNIQWFPGHMAKTRRKITEELSKVDVVIELRDARIPISSRNPEIDSLIGNKPCVIVMNKSDLSDPEANKKWIDYYKEKGQQIVFINSLTGKGVNLVKDAVMKVMQSKIERLKEKGRIFKSVRTMVVGIPNVGKSSFINRLCGKSITVTGDKPGVTRSNQWVRVNDDIQLLDTPGILWPKFDDERIGMHLAFTGAIKDQIMDIETLGLRLVEKLMATYPDELAARFKLGDEIDLANATGLEVMELCAKKRGCILPGKNIDYTRIANVLLDEFRGGIIGNITLELPEGL